MLSLARGQVVELKEQVGTAQYLLVSHQDGEQRLAYNDSSLYGEAAIGDEVVVNTAALDLKLGSGGFDVVHVNLSSGLGGRGVNGAHVMKLNYSSLQHAVLPIEDELSLELPLGVPVGVFFLHGQLPTIVWAINDLLPTAKVGYVQTTGGALPGGMSKTVRDLRERGLLAGHITAGQSYGGEQEAITTAGGIYHGSKNLDWDIVLCGPGPGILGSNSALGHGGLIALESAHTALALGAKTVVVPRMSSGDPRERHRGLSHHTATTLELLLQKVTVPLPSDQDISIDRHETVSVDVDVDGYRASGLPRKTMGRDIDQDRLFFEAALAGGAVLAKLAR